ncbi:hypothetical protein ASE03_10825, partial [Kitasatospora sp. Root187]
MRIALTPARLGAAALVAVPLIATGLAGQAQAATSVTQDRLTPTSMAANTATKAGLTVHSSACFTAKTLGVGVRDAVGRNLDFPGNASNVQICPSGVNFTSAARTLPAGTYTQFGFWQDYSGGWHNLPSQKLTVGSSV